MGEKTVSLFPVFLSSILPAAPLPGLCFATCLSTNVHEITRVIVYQFADLDLANRVDRYPADSEPIKMEAGSY